MTKPILRNRSSRLLIEILISTAIFSSVIFMLNYRPFGCVSPRGQSASVPIAAAQ